MIRLDDQFLASLGLAALSPEDKRSLLDHIYETLELRVGMKLAERMNDAQLDEFEGFIDGQSSKARDYLNAHKTGWEASPEFAEHQQKAATKNQPPERTVADFAALKWLEANFPDHKQVVEAQLEQLKKEIQSQAPTILQAAQADGAMPPSV